MHLRRLIRPVVVVVVQIFNASRNPRHIEAAAIVMYMYLYSLAFMDHPCTLGAAVCHQVPPCPLYTQPRAQDFLGINKLNSFFVDFIDV